MDEKIINTSCSHDCGGRCVLKPHVKDGKIVRFESDTGEEPQLRACLRGRAYRQQVYAPDRIQYPMKRTGERGEGKFARISWDEALDTVAREMLRIKKDYGNASILLLWGGGSQAVLNGPMAVERLMAQFGGYTRAWGAASYEGPLFASMATYGTMNTGSARADHLNTKLMIMWGWNPAVTIWDPNTAYLLAQVKEKGIRIISIDPRLTDTTAVFASEWIPIRPSTDTAMMIAIAYVIIKKNLQDQNFLDTYTIGFDEFKNYVNGEEDGIPKTPEWAEKITGVPAATIERIAVEYATTKPAVLIPGWGPARGSMGEQFTRAACAVIAMTGNIGKEGGYAGGFMRAFHSREMSLPRTTKNAVEAGAAHRPNSLYKIRGAGHPTAARMHEVHVYDAILKGKAGGYSCDPKMAYIVASNFLNSRPDVNTGIAAFKKLGFIVIHEQRMTPTARFADILLPVNTFMEREDIAPPWLGSPYYLYVNPAIESRYESKSDFQICCELAPRLGIPDYAAGKDAEGWLRFVAERAGDITDFNSFKKDGVVKLKVEPFVAFKQEIADPANHPFPTPSGKIEIYSESLGEWQNPQMPAIPKYVPAPEGYGDPLQKKYPLQLLTSHHKPATHSTLEKIPWLEETEPRRLWLSTQDAKARGIADNDEILVFNDRGKVRIRAYVTDRITPGAVCLPHGGWFEIDENGVDIGGCENTLVPRLHSPGGAWSANTALVEVRREG
ncbi:MAG: molybdopterin-dependent oxidoreductase [Dehalococcoidales bacterium]|nr:molybdopterin-dependent oxidoreductase [Dehalococcoidales bacterium]